jgi:hypothetical protein
MSLNKTEIVRQILLRLSDTKFHTKIYYSILRLLRVDRLASWRQNMLRTHATASRSHMWHWDRRTATTQSTRCFPFETFPNYFLRLKSFICYIFPTQHTIPFVRCVNMWWNSHKGYEEVPHFCEPAFKTFSVFKIIMHIWLQTHIFLLHSFIAPYNK